MEEWGKRRKRRRKRRRSIRGERRRKIETGEGGLEEGEWRRVGEGGKREEKREGRERGGAKAIRGEVEVIWDKERKRRRR